MRRTSVVLVTVAVATALAVLNFTSEYLHRRAHYPDSLTLSEDDLTHHASISNTFYNRVHRYERKQRLEGYSVLSEEERTGGQVRVGVQQAQQPTVNSDTARATTNSEETNDAYQHTTGDNKQQYHVVVSVDGSVYVQWQVRICYYWYQQAKRKNPDASMGGLTRLLHSGAPDALMEEIPTKVVNPLPPGIDKGYVVLHRPYAFLQWAINHMQDIEEDYVLMAEPDHIILKPPPLWATPTRPSAYPFSYIEPAKAGNKEIISKFNSQGVPVEQMAQIGNSPVMMHKAQLADIVPIWYDLSLRMKKDPQADKAFGWILEMYAFSIASSQHKDGPIQYELHPEFAVQPPWDAKLTTKDGKDVSIIHYTYGNDLNEQGVFTPGSVGAWHWDKRDYTNVYPDRPIAVPPPACRNEVVKALVQVLNKAMADIEPWQIR